MKILLIFSAVVASLFATTTPVHVELDIYSNKAFLNKTYELRESGEITTRVPTQTTLASIRYKTEQSCQVKSSSLSHVKKEINPELQNLRKDKAKKSLEVEAIVAKNRLLKTLSLERVESLSKMEQISSHLAKNLIENLRLKEILKKEIEQIEKELNEISSTKERYKKLVTIYECRVPWKKMTISYPLNGIRYTPFYNISANTHDKSITIEKKATLFFKGVESYKDIDLNIHSYRFNQKVAPLPFYPRFLGQKMRAHLAKSEAVMSVARDIDIQHQELETKSLYRVKGVELKAGEKNLLRIDKKVVDASFKSVIDAYGTNRAYLEATFKSEKSYISVHANLFLNQNPIASKHINRIQKDKETKLYFGEDQHIQIEKELIKTLDEKTFFGDKKISTQNWKYTITNKKPYSADIEFIARAPVSKDANIEVNTLARPEFNSQSAEGKTIWSFRLEANAKKEIIFGYEILKTK